MDCSFMDIGENRNKAPSLSRNLNSFCYIFFLSEIQITKTMNEIEKLEDEYIKAQSLKTWQEQFDNEFRAYWTEAPEPIKDFISNLLQERDKELVERIKKARAKGFEDKTILESIETDLLFRHHN